MANTIKQEGALVGHMKSDETLSGTMSASKIYKETVSIPATKDMLGLIKVGDNLSVTEDGTLSAEVPTKTSELENDSGFITEEYKLPVASENQLGGVKAKPKTDDMSTPVGIDKDGNLWAHAISDVETIGAEKVIFNGNMVLTEAFGKYKPSGGKVVVPSDGKSLKGLLLDAYSEDKNPKITQPSISISSSTAKAYEVGTVVTPTYVGSFNPGKYEYGPSTGVTITEWLATNNVTDEKKPTQNGQFASYTVVDGANYKITLSGTHTDGAIPSTALESEYVGGQIKGGIKTATSGIITGYRNSFYGTTVDKSAEITSDVIRGLSQKSGKRLVNSNSFTVNIPVGALRVIIAYPATLRNVTSIKDVNGLNADITSAFTPSVVAVNGANKYEAIDYKVYVLDFANPNDTANRYTVTI